MARRGYRGYGDGKGGGEGKIKQYKQRVHKVVSAPAKRYEVAEVDVLQGKMTAVYSNQIDSWYEASGYPATIEMFYDFTDHRSFFQGNGSRVLPKV